MRNSLKLLCTLTVLALIGCQSGHESSQSHRHPAPIAGRGMDGGHDEEYHYKHEHMHEDSHGHHHDHDNHHHDEQGQHDHRDGSVRKVEIKIPPGHLPPPGSCKVWHPGKPPGHQPPPGRCRDLASNVPPGAWLISRPPQEPHLAVVQVFHPRRHGKIVETVWIDAKSGKVVHHER